MNHTSYSIPTDAPFSIRLPDGDFLTRHDARSRVIVLAPPKVNPTRPRPTPGNCRFAATVADRLGVTLKVETIPAHRIARPESDAA